ncbi:hypothetical protein EIP91_007782 [Steccherinum ochraceum]|uniref:DUF8190 domain-containing protein n=1 Tax=Steccherinum ochraceum TaxID=92696 RepID=A0A4R0R3T5_9APHY|nr:hypothetical protein EIP91_007782 [Steccherinum ochraceum]
MPAQPEPREDDVFIHNADEANAVDALLGGNHAQEGTHGIDLTRPGGFLEDDNDALRQGDVLEHFRVHHPTHDLESQIQSFDTFPTEYVHVSQFKGDWANDRKGTSALRLVQKTQITGLEDEKVSTPALSTKHAFVRDSDRVDGTVFWPDRAGWDVACKPDDGEAQYAQNYQLNFVAGHWWYRMRCNPSYIGFDVDHRILYVGRLFHEELWVVVTPNAHVGRHNPNFAPYKAPHDHDPYAMSMKQYYVIMGFVARCFSRGGIGAVHSTEYPRIDSHAQFMQDCNIINSENKNGRFALGYDDVLVLHTYFRHFPQWIADAPVSHQLPEYMNCQLLVTSTCFGQNTPIYADGFSPLEYNRWNVDRCYRHIKFLGIALARQDRVHKVDSYVELPDHYLRQDVPNNVLYTSWDENIRELVVDVNALPEKDGQGQHVEVYDEDGYWVQRFVAETMVEDQQRGVLIDLQNVSRLYNLTQWTEFDDQDRPINPDDYKVKYYGYPLAFTKRYGHVQATNGFASFLPMVKELEKHIMDDEDEDVQQYLSQKGRVLRVVSSQCYNAYTHRVRESKSSHQIQRGIPTATVGGTYGRGRRKEQTICHRLADNYDFCSPWRGWERQVDNVDDLNLSLRLEQFFMINLSYVKPEFRTGGAIYRDIIGPLIKFYEHGSMRSAIRNCVIVFNEGYYPDLLKWTTFGIGNVVDHIYTNFFQTPIRDSTAPLPQHHWVEMVAILDRCLNYAHTGHAKVLSRQLMGPLFTDAALLTTGFPFIHGVLRVKFESMIEFTLGFNHNEWPREKGRRNLPLSASDKALQLTYGIPYWRLYKSQFIVSDALACALGQTLPLDKVLVFVCRRMLQLFIADVVDTVKKHVVDELVPLATDPDLIVRDHAVARHNAITTWAKSDYPLSFGNDNIIRRNLVTGLTPLHPADAGVAPRPGLHMGSVNNMSTTELAGKLYDFGDRHSSKPVRLGAPLFDASFTASALPVGVSELQVYLKRRFQMTPKEQKADIVAAFNDAILGLRILTVPAAPPTAHAGHNFIWAVPGYWTSISAVGGPPVGNAAPIDNRDPIARAVDEDAENNLAGDWYIFGKTLADYKSVLDKDCPPKEFDVPGLPGVPAHIGTGTKKADASDIIGITYRWVDNFVRKNPRATTTLLGRHLAWLYVHACPQLHAREDAILPGVDVNQAVRNADWIYIETRGGTHDTHINFIQMYIWIVALSEKRSPLLKYFVEHNNGFGPVWIKRHTQKGICGYNLVRLQVAEALQPGIFGSGRFNQAWRIRPEPQLRAWLQEIHHAFETSPNGVIPLVRKIFGNRKGSEILAKAHMLPAEALPPPLPAARRKRSRPQGRDESDDDEDVMEIEEDEFHRALREGPSSQRQRR